MQNSKTRIERNRNIAKMRLRNRKDPVNYEQFISDLFWSPEEWPDHIVNCLFAFKYTDRICVCNFFFGNGLAMNDSFRYIKFYHSWNDAECKSYEMQFIDLWTRLGAAVRHTHDNWEYILSHYYFYSMQVRAVLFFDGTIRMNAIRINVVHNNNVNNSIGIPHRRPQNISRSTQENHNLDNLESHNP